MRTHPNIDLYLNTQVKRTSGSIGNFTTTLEQDNGAGLEAFHGATILATGGREFKPTEYLYAKHPNVMTHLDFDEALNREDKRLERAGSVVFIQCVGSRDADRPYCSKTCCTHSLKAALALKTLNPKVKLYVIYRDIRAYGFREEIYKEAREKGVVFIRYDLTQKPSVAIRGEDTLLLTVNDHVLRRPIRIKPDLLVLAAGIVPNDNRALFEQFKVPINAEGFLVEAHAKLRPVDFASEGIFLAGLAHYPKPIEETIAQAKAAASRAMTLLAKDALRVGGVVAEVTPGRCAACLTCVRTCPYGIPRIGEHDYAVIDPAQCHGCGICAAECPGKAIELKHYTDEQLIAKSEALFAGR